MRELKFRTWDGYEMSAPFSLLDLKPGILFGGDVDEELDIELPFPTQHHDLHDNELVFMQFTGLHDKNGKEIYEGDIILHDEIRFEVIWSNGRFLLRHERKWLDDERNIWNIGESGMEVIGNRFENPELLGEVK